MRSQNSDTGCAVTWSCVASCILVAERRHKVHCNMVVDGACSGCIVVVVPAFIHFTMVTRTPSTNRALTLHRQQLSTRGRHQVLQCWQQHITHSVHMATRLHPHLTMTSTIHARYIVE